MKRISIPFALIVLAAMIVPFTVLSQDDLEDVTMNEKKVKKPKKQQKKGKGKDKAKGKA